MRKKNNEEVTAILECEHIWIIIFCRTDALPSKPDSKHLKDVTVLLLFITWNCFVYEKHSFAAHSSPQQHRNYDSSTGEELSNRVIRVIVKRRNRRRKQMYSWTLKVSGLTRLGPCSDQLKLAHHGKAWLSPSWVGLAPLCLAWPSPGWHDSIPVGSARLS